MPDSRSADTAVSVIITNYNGKKFLPDCINSVLSQTYEPAEIFVVDNDSTDGSIELIREEFPGVKLIEMGENTGFARATNRGIRESSGVYVALLNNDAMAEPQWLENLVRASGEGEAIGFCASKMLFSWNRNLINNAGIELTDYGLPYDRGFYVSDSSAFAENRIVFGACGGAVLFKREMLDRIGLFEEDFFLCYDDADLSFRAQLAGYKCMYVADAVVYHAGGGTVPYQGKTARFYSCRHYVTLLVKNMPGRILLSRLAPIVWFCLKNAAKSILEHRDFINLHGYLSGLASIRRNLKLRRKILAGATTSPSEIRSMMVTKERMLRETAPRKPE